MDHLGALFFYTSLFVNKGTCRNLRTGRQICVWGGGGLLSPEAALAYDSLLKPYLLLASGCMYGRLSHAAKLGSSRVQNWLRPQMGKDAGS